MTFVGCDSVLCRCNTGENEVTVDIQFTANGINDFEHSTFLSKYLRKQALTDRSLKNENTDDNEPFTRRI